MEHHEKHPSSDDDQSQPQEAGGRTTAPLLCPLLDAGVHRSRGVHILSASPPRVPPTTTSTDGGRKSCKRGRSEAAGLGKSRTDAGESPIRRRSACHAPASSAANDSQTSSVYHHDGSASCDDAEGATYDSAASSRPGLRATLQHTGRAGSASKRPGLKHKFAKLTHRQGERAVSSDRSVPSSTRGRSDSGGDASSESSPRCSADGPDLAPRRGPGTPDTAEQVTCCRCGQSVPSSSRARMVDAETQTAHPQPASGCDLGAAPTSPAEYWTHSRQEQRTPPQELIQPAPHPQLSAFGRHPVPHSEDQQGQILEVQHLQQGVGHIDLQNGNVGLVGPMGVEYDPASYAVLQPLGQPSTLSLPSLAFQPGVQAVSFQERQMAEYQEQQEATKPQPQMVSCLSEVQDKQGRMVEFARDSPVAPVSVEHDVASSVATPGHERARVLSSPPHYGASYAPATPPGVVLVPAAHFTAADPEFYISTAGFSAPTMPFEATNVQPSQTCLVPPGVSPFWIVSGIHGIPNPGAAPPNYHDAPGQENFPDETRTSDGPHQPDISDGDHVGNVQEAVQIQIATSLNSPAANSDHVSPSSEFSSEDGQVTSTVNIHVPITSETTSVARNLYGEETREVPSEGSHEDLREEPNGRPRRGPREGPGGGIRRRRADRRLTGRSVSTSDTEGATSGPPAEKDCRAHRPLTCGPGRVPEPLAPWEVPHLIRAEHVSPRPGASSISSLSSWWSLSMSDSRSRQSNDTSSDGDPSPRSRHQESRSSSETGTSSSEDASPQNHHPERLPEPKVPPPGEGLLLPGSSWENRPMAEHSVPDNEQMPVLPALLNTKDPSSAKLFRPFTSDLPMVRQSSVDPSKTATEMSKEQQMKPRNKEVPVADSGTCYDDDSVVCPVCGGVFEDAPDTTLHRAGGCCQSVKAAVSMEMIPPTHVEYIVLTLNSRSASHGNRQCTGEQSDDEQGDACSDDEQTGGQSGDEEQDEHWREKELEEKEPGEEDKKPAEPSSDRETIPARPDQAPVPAPGCSRRPDAGRWHRRQEPLYGGAEPLDTVFERLNVYGAGANGECRYPFHLHGYSPYLQARGSEDEGRWLSHMKEFVKSAYQCDHTRQVSHGSTRGSVSDQQALAAAGGRTNGSAVAPFRNPPHMEASVVGSGTVVLYPQARLRENRSEPNLRAVSGYLEGQPRQQSVAVGRDGHDGTVDTNVVRTSERNRQNSDHSQWDVVERTEAFLRDLSPDSLDPCEDEQTKGACAAPPTDRTGAASASLEVRVQARDHVPHPCLPHPRTSRGATQTAGGRVYHAAMSRPAEQGPYAPGSVGMRQQAESSVVVASPQSLSSQRMPVPQPRPTWHQLATRSLPEQRQQLSFHKSTQHEQRTQPSFERRQEVPRSHRVPHQQREALDFARQDTQVGAAAAEPSRYRAAAHTRSVSSPAPGPPRNVQVPVSCEGRTVMECFELPPDSRLSQPEPHQVTPGRDVMQAMTMLPQSNSLQQETLNGLIHARNSLQQTLDVQQQVTGMPPDVRNMPVQMGNVQEVAIDAFQQSLSLTKQAEEDLQDLDLSQEARNGSLQQGLCFPQQALSFHQQALRFPQDLRIPHQAFSLPQHAVIIPQHALTMPRQPFSMPYQDLATFPQQALIMPQQAPNTPQAMDTSYHTLSMQEQYLSMQQQEQSMLQQAPYLFQQVQNRVQLAQNRSEQMFDISPQTPNSLQRAGYSSLRQAAIRDRDGARRAGDGAQRGARHRALPTSGQGLLPDPPGAFVGIPANYQLIPFGQQLMYPGLQQLASYGRQQLARDGTWRAGSSLPPPAHQDESSYHE